MSPAEVEHRIQEIDWWHQIDLGNGMITPGRGGDTAERIEKIAIPRRLESKSVLDIGAWDGALSFEAERRGASRVVAVNEKPKPGLELARQVLNSKVESVEADLMDLTPQQIGGPFDVVLFVGVLYHLPDPIGGLKRVYELVAPGGMLILETDTRLNNLTRPAAELVEDRRGIDNYDRNWWRPNRAAVVSLCRQVRFSRVTVVLEPYSQRPGLLVRAARKLPFRQALKHTLPALESRPSLRCVVHAWKSAPGERKSEARVP